MHTKLAARYGPVNKRTCIGLPLGKRGKKRGALKLLSVYKSRDNRRRSERMKVHKAMQRIYLRKLKSSKLFHTFFYVCMRVWWARWLSRYSDWLRAGRFGVRNPGGGEIFRICHRPTLGSTQLPVQLVPGLHRG
jgi:hypothetical protein